MSDIGWVNFGDQVIRVGIELFIKLKSLEGKGLVKFHINLCGLSSLKK